MDRKERSFDIRRPVKEKVLLWDDVGVSGESVELSLLVLGERASSLCVHGGDEGEFSIESGVEQLVTIPKGLTGAVRVSLMGTSILAAPNSVKVEELAEENEPGTSKKKSSVF